MSKARAKKIKLILFDVDGVLTDGKIWIFPAPAGARQATQQQAAQYEDKGGFGLLSQTMIEAKGFHAHDGTAVSLARLAGIKTGIITKRVSDTVACVPGISNSNMCTWESRTSSPALRASSSGKT